MEDEERYILSTLLEDFQNYQDKGEYNKACDIADRVMHNLLDTLEHLEDVVEGQARDLEDYQTEEQNKNDYLLSDLDEQYSLLLKELTKREYFIIETLINFLEVDRYVKLINLNRVETVEFD